MSRLLVATRRPRSVKKTAHSQSFLLKTPTSAQRRRISGDVECCAHVGIDENLGVRAGGFAHGVDDADVAIQTLGNRHPASAAADLDFEVAVAVLLAAADLFAKKLSSFFVSRFQVVDVDGAIIEFNLSRTARA